MTASPSIADESAGGAISAARDTSSYGQILRATSVIGGVQVITVLVGLLRNKAAAVLIGPVGVGLLGSYQQVQTLVAMIAGLGVHSSAVREIAAATESGDADRLTRLVLALRRVCWVLGLLGATAAVLLREPISRWTFDTPQYASGIVAVGFAVLLTCVSDGQLALVRGQRRLADLATMTVVNALAGVVASIVIFRWRGPDGIPLMIIVTAIVQLTMSFFLVRRVPLAPVRERWSASAAAATPLLRLGIAMMSVSAIEGVVALGTRSIIIRELGAAPLGAFSAANSLSMVLVSFVLSAMIADYFPRLSASATDPTRMCNLINEQIEVGLILAAPGIVAVIGLAPLLVTSLYSFAFGDAVRLLPWLALGSLLRVLAWPLQAVMTALGRGRWHVTVLGAMNGLLIVLVAGGARLGGLTGVGIAFAVHGLLLNVVLALVARQLCAFAYGGQALSLAMRLLPLITLAFLVTLALPSRTSMLVDAVMALFTGVLCLRALAVRLGPSHRVVRTALAIPLFRRLCGV